MSAYPVRRRQKKRKERAYHEGIGRLTHTQFETGPVQTSGRQPWGLAVGVLIVGAVVLLVAMGARPLISAMVAKPETMGDLSVPRQVSMPAIVRPATAMAPPSQDETEPALPVTEATTLPPEGPRFHFDSPTLKPRGTHQVAAVAAGPMPDQRAKDRFTPRRKPRGQSNTIALDFAGGETQSAPAIDVRDPLSVHPLNLQQTALYSTPLRPTSFFATADMGEAEMSDDGTGSSFSPYTDARLKRSPKRLSDQALLASFDGDLTASARTQTIQLRRGETIASLFSRTGISGKDQSQIIKALGPHIRLRALPSGYRFEVTLQAANQTAFQQAQGDSSPAPTVTVISTRTSDGNKLSLKRQEDGTFAAKLAAVERTRRLRASSGEIRGNLYLSMKAKGAPDSVINAFANVFAYDIDFQRDIFAGDRFEAIYEVIYDDEGNIVDGGQILFGRLSWRGQRREKGYYFFDPATSTQRADYFDTQGKSARRLLMKTPIDGARLSSRFGPRKHPILGYRKTHKGVDFAARRGTPIKATGDGTIERANRFGSYGNYIRIKHANRYKTAYAHLKGFARGIRKGKRVRQGDIIGYVGTTGRSTGPHLHYEVHYRGKPVNPQALKIATGTVLTGKTSTQFERHREKIDRLRSPAFERAPQLTQMIGAP